MAAPRVWLKFSAKRSDGTTLDFLIQDLTTNRVEDVIDFETKHFFPSDNIQKATGIYRNPESNEEATQIMREMLKSEDDVTVICCLDDGNHMGEIIGVSSIGVQKNDGDDFLKDLESKVQTKEVRKMLEIVTGMSKLHNLKEKYISEGYYEGRGVVVHPDYRGLGIAQQLLKVRRLVCEEHGYPMTMAWMTAIGSQKAAERDGWETVFEIPFDELGRLFGVTFEDAPPMCKLMLVEVK